MEFILKPVLRMRHYRAIRRKLKMLSHTPPGVGSRVRFELHPRP